MMQPKTVLVERDGIPNGLLINADDFNPETDKLFTPPAAPTSGALIEAAAAELEQAQAALATLQAADPAASDDQIAAATKTVTDLEAKIHALTTPAG